MMGLPIRPLLAAGILLAAPLLGACHNKTDVEVDNGKVQFHLKQGSIAIHNGIVIVHVDGREPAYVTKHGHLVIGRTNDDEVPTDDAQRAALSGYNKAANTLISKAVQVGVEGVHFAADAIGIAIKDAVNGDSQNIDKDVEKGTQKLKDKAHSICNQMQEWRDSQDQVTKLVPAFAPYAIIGDIDIKDCWDEGIKKGEDQASADRDADTDADDSDDDSDDAATSSESKNPAAPPSPPAPVAPPPPGKAAAGGELKGT